MIKRDELSNPGSCMSRALPHERTFVVLARDITAPATIREWCRLRCIRGLNLPKDPQITEALQCADLMETERSGIRAELAGGDDYIAWMCWKHRHGNDQDAYLSLCDSDTPNAFKVYRRKS